MSAEDVGYNMMIGLLLVLAIGMLIWSLTSLFKNGFNGAAIAALLCAVGLVFGAFMIAVSNMTISF